MTEGQGIELASREAKNQKDTLPVPPDHELLNFLLFIIVLQKVKHAVIKSFRVCHCICSGEHS
jgi:hypothetical protein